MARPSVEYIPRDPGGSVLYHVVRDHFETFRAEAVHLRDGEGLPRFVEKEFEAFLRCGWLAGGFARFRCGDCGTDRLVAFSCKGRGFCGSCGGRRMTERAAHLVDHVFPDAPVRQWVLSLPPRIRYLLAWRHDVCKAAVRVLLREVNRHLRDRARACGLADPRGGAVAIVQRFGGALNLNVHIHALVLDGVFARAADGRLAFHAATRITDADVADVLAAIQAGVMRLLGRRGLGQDGDGDRSDTFAEATPVLAGLAAASAQGVVALGPKPGTRPVRRGATSEGPAERRLGACHARWEGFDLHAGLLVPAGDRDRLERVCRYTLRPPVADERLHVGADGQVVLQLRHPWADGTTALVFEPTVCLERLAVLVPRPRINLVLYHGVLAPRAAWRAEVVRRQAPVVSAVASPAAPTPAPEPASPDHGSGSRWANLMRRAFGFDVLACPRCGGRLRLIALLDASAVTQRILRHLGLPAEVPEARPARAPPLGDYAA
ncbi:MAG: transposase [Vicinamibacterales bacterium]